MGDYIVTTCGKKFYVDEVSAQAWWDYIENREDYLFEAMKLEVDGKTVIVPLDQISYYVEDAEDISTDELEDFNE